MFRTVEELQQNFVDHLPFCKEMGIVLTDLDHGVELRLPYSDAYIGDPKRDVIHGGAVSTLLDTALGCAVFAHPENGGMTATIGLRIDYMRSADPKKDIYAYAEVYHTTRNVAFVRGEAWDEDRNELVASAVGTFTFQRREL